MPSNSKKRTVNEQQFIETIKENYIAKSAFIGICGLSGSGKTTLAQKLCNTFPERSLAINLDDFCIATTRKRKSYLNKALSQENINQLTYLANPSRKEDNPFANPVSWYDWQAIANTLSDLKQDKKVIRHNTWNQATGECDLTITYKPPKHEYPLYFIDCIYLYEPEITSYLDKVVLLNTSKKEAYARKTKRDQHRNNGLYIDYKKLTTELYCIPYLNKYKNQMDYIIKENI